MQLVWGGQSELLLQYFLGKTSLALFVHVGLFIYLFIFEGAVVSEFLNFLFVPVLWFFGG